MANIRKTEPPFAGWLLDLNEREMFVLRRSLEGHRRNFLFQSNVTAVHELLRKLPDNLPDR